ADKFEIAEWIVICRNVNRRLGPYVNIVSTSEVIDNQLGELAVWNDMRLSLLGGNLEIGHIRKEILNCLCLCLSPPEVLPVKHWLIIERIVLHG
ncbi:hypothetical protein Tco_0147580, partial [Tanacetum coccineum]